MEDEALEDRIRHSGAEIIGPTSEMMDEAYQEYADRKRSCYCNIVS